MSNETKMLEQIHRENCFIVEMLARIGKMEGPVIDTLINEWDKKFKEAKEN